MLHRAYLEHVPYEDLAVQLGETGPLDEAALAAARAAATAAAATASSSTRCWRRCCGRRVRRHPPPGGRRRRGPDQPHGAARAPRRRALARGRRAGRGLPRAAAVPRGPLRRSGRSPTRWSARPSGSWWMGQHEWGSFNGFRMSRGGVAGRGLRGPSPAAGDRPGVELRQDARRPEPASRPDRHAARADALRRSGRRSTPSGCVGDRDEFAAVLRDVFGVTVGGERLDAPVGRGRRPARGVPGPRLMQVATHPGNFHADDVFAVAVLALVHGAAGDRPHARRRAGRRGRRPCRHRRALGPRDRRLRPPPARRRGRARQRHPVRELRPGLARLRRRARRRRRTPRRRSTSGSSRASTPTTPARTSAPRWSTASGR